MKLNKYVTLILLMIVLIFLPGCFVNTPFSIGQGITEKTLFVGDKVHFNTNITNSDVVGTVIWETSDELVAAVDQTGLVVALKVGTANITATLNGYINTVVINVIDKNENIDIEISGKQTVLINKTTVLKANCNIQDAKYIWSSSDETIASVDQTGTVKGIKPGVVTIKAALEENDEVYSEVTILVRTGDGIQDIITNYIYQNIYITGGNYDATSLSEKVVNMVKKVEKSVIGISNYDNIQGTSLAGTGTGGIFKKEKVSDGYKYTVFTNYHVVEDAFVVKVYLGDIDEFVTAQVIKSNETIDIAILTFVHENEYDPLIIGDPNKLSNGEFVIAMGNPGGYTYYGSVTFGAISCYNRIKDSSGVVYVQHDTPINPGNSGGPLFNLNGEVIGINTLKIAAADIEGMGFAISLESLQEYLN